MLKQRSKLLHGVALAVGIVSLGAGQALLQNKAEAQSNEVPAPRFQADPFWPKPLPNNWLLGSVIGVWADEQDNAWNIAFSKDPEQRFVFMADGQNQKVRVILREALEELATFGDGGRQPGQFYGVHGIATDAKGNLHTTDTYEGKRVQKFLNLGAGGMPRGHQGVP